MNIAFLNSIEKDTYGGMEEWIRLAAVGLAKRKHTISLIGRADSYFLKRAADPYDELKQLSLDISGDFNPATISKIKKYLEEQKIDILTVNFNKDVRLGGLAARMSGHTKIVWSVGLNITKDAFVHKFLTPKLIDRVVTPSESLKNEIISLGYIAKDITEVIPISIEDISFKLDKFTARNNLIGKYKLPDNVILSVTSGRFVEQKGHEFLIEASRKIIKEFPNMRFIFLGDGPRRELLENMIQKYDLEKYFIFAGMQDNIDTELFGADIMIHPSRVEPFGIAVLEGMRASLPIVASNVGGIPEVVKENYNALLVTPCDASALSDAVLKVLRDKIQFVQMSVNSRKRFEDYFQMDRMIDKIEKCYQDLCQQKLSEKN